MQQYNNNDQADYQTGSRRGNLASRNASSFDIISFNPEAQSNASNQDKLDKKQKQAAYRDQLDSMVSNKNDNKRNQRAVTEEYNGGGFGEQDYQRERRVEPRQDDRRYDEEANAQDKKKRMMQEINDANRRAAQNKAHEKQRQKADELAADNQRTQDSLTQFERDGFRQRENKKYLNEENNKVLGQQLRESNNRKQEQNYTPSYDSVDQLQYNNDRDSRNPLAPSYSKMNQGQPQSLDNLAYKMDKLSTSCPFARDDGSNYQEEKSYGRKRVDEPQSRNNIDNGAQYQKNRGKAQYSNFNIINHQG